LQLRRARSRPASQLCALCLRASVVLGRGARILGVLTATFDRRIRGAGKSNHYNDLEEGNVPCDRPLSGCRGVNLTGVVMNNPNQGGQRGGQQKPGQQSQQPGQGGQHGGQQQGGGGQQKPGQQSQQPGQGGQQKPGQSGGQHGQR